MPFSMFPRIVPHSLALSLILACSASAAEVSFRSSAPLPDPGPAGVEAALEDALVRLLVRVTGRRGAAGLVERFPAASSIVTHWRPVGAGSLEAEFDEEMIRRVLEEEGEAVWEGERTRLTLWLVINDGERWLFRPVGSSSPQETDVSLRGVFSGALTQAFTEVSALRGIEIDFRPGPGQDVTPECTEEIWTGSFGCLPDGAGALSILGRVAVPGALDDIEWSMREKGTWREIWESDAAGAVHRVTDMLAARFMATQGPVRTYLLVISPVPDLEAYTGLKAGLAAVQAVRDWEVQSAAGDALTLRISSRTAEAPLRVALASLGVQFELTRTGS